MSRKTRRKVRSGSGMSKLMLLLSLAILILFLWGRVHIDFVMQEIDTLNVRKHALLLEIDELQIQVEALKQYQRIVSMAKHQGLVRIERSDYKNLKVDVSGLREFDFSDNTGVQIAGFGLPHQWNEKSFVSPFEENHAVQ